MISIFLDSPTQQEIIEIANTFNSGTAAGYNEILMCKFKDSIHLVSEPLPPSYSVLQIIYPNLPAMMIRRNQIVVVNHFAICFSCLPKNQNICTIDVFLTGNCVVRELHLLQDYKGVTSQYWENTGKRELVNAEHETLYYNYYIAYMQLRRPSIVAF